MNNKFSKNLKFLRKKNKYKQQDVAKAINVARNTYSNYETGKSEPNFDTLIELSKFFNCPIDYLLSDNIETLNKISNLKLLDKFDIDMFSHNKIINDLEKSKNYYIEYLEKINKKIQEIDTLINLLKNISTNNDNSQCCTIETIKDTYKIELSNKISIPLIGAIAAGSPVLAISNIEDYLNLPLKAPLNSCKNYYCLRVKGDSMNKLFKNDDVLIIEETNNVNDYDIAVVLIDNTEATVKKVKFEDNFVYLIPESNNPIYKTQKYDNTKVNIKIQGKAITTLKEYLDK
ncbi:XRE family transcriptional regulator [Clostridium faecium]|uniref:Helix-turn-helix domain-containing protein n=1 Tax=Clostridium faecium TaxID=2762223 RepID=A0ABR8YNX3_9CLOT|nr:XRE family transcriptional regulator [Clostridium faecium]MBD8045837.1 helix-turn-helix domain-containing protein [Clostridium faecium]